LETNFIINTINFLLICNEKTVNFVVVASGSTDLSEARRLAKASIIVSVVGIVVVLITVAVVVGVYASRTTTSTTCYFNGIQVPC
jgi:hypothetical protein